MAWSKNDLRFLYTLRIAPGDFPRVLLPGNVLAETWPDDERLKASWVPPTATPPVARKQKP